MRGILLEEFHVIFSASTKLPGPERDAAQRILRGRRFLLHLRRAVAETLLQFPALAGVRVAVAH